MKDYDASEECITKVFSITEAKYGYKSEQSAISYIEKAKIYACQENWKDAI